MENTQKQWKTCEKHWKTVENMWMSWHHVRAVTCNVQFCRINTAAHGFQGAHGPWCPAYGGSMVGHHQSPEHVAHGFQGTHIPWCPARFRYLCRKQKRLEIKNACIYTTQKYLFDDF